MCHLIYVLLYKSLSLLCLSLDHCFECFGLQITWFEYEHSQMWDVVDLSMVCNNGPYLLTLVYVFY